MQRGVNEAFSDSDEEAPVWFDARDWLDAHDALEAQGGAPAAAAPAVGPPIPCEPADDDDWLPPGGASPQTRATALAAMTAAVLNAPDTGARAASEPWPDGQTLHARAG